MDLVTNSKYPEIVLVRAVQALEPPRVRVTFTDGTQRAIDLSPFLRGPMFQSIRDDPLVFASVFVDPEGHTLAWPNGADIAPETLYYQGLPPWAKPVESRSSRRPSVSRKRRNQASKRRVSVKA